MHPIHIGTSGWAYDDWLGPFYARGTKKAEYLVRYAEQFDVVEVDSTYYASPARRTVEGWAARTPAHFRFALKMPGEITHERVLDDCDAQMDLFLDALEPLRAKLQCVLLQFGHFSRSAFASASPFFERLQLFLERYAPRLQLAVEIRNSDWLTREYFNLLRAHTVPAALVEHTRLPPIDQVVNEHDVVTGPFSYLRLIGDRHGIEAMTQKWGELVIDRTRDIERVANAIERIAVRTPVVTYVNNHYSGHGPATCRQLQARLGIQRPTVRAVGFQGGLFD